MVVSPPDLGKEQRPPRERHQKISVEKETDKSKGAEDPVSLEP